MFKKLLLVGMSLFMLCSPAQAQILEDGWDGLQKEFDTGYMVIVFKKAKFGIYVHFIKEDYIFSAKGEGETFQKAMDAARQSMTLTPPGEDQ